jgi:hypothetical protein
MRFRARSGLLLAACCLAGAGAARAQDSADSTRGGGSFWRATAGVAAVNWITWAYNWYVQRWPWAKVGTRSWARNLHDGFVWDDDCFLDNQLAHPYHGSLYHSSARASGYGFWGSVPFVAVGSASWELFGENITASLNDLINTTFGGVALGEVTYRLSSMLGSKRAAGSRGVGQELGAFALSPMGRAQGLLGSGRPGVLPEAEGLASVSLGRRSGRPFFQLAARNGNPFDPGALRPYDAFDFRLQISPDPTGSIRLVAITGILTRKNLNQESRSRWVLGLFQHYEFEHLATLELGGQSVSGALLYQRELGRRNQLRFGAHLEGVVLGAISADHGFEWRRDYDLGPGAGARLNAALVRDGREWLRADGRVVWLHSLHGSGGDHSATQLRLTGSLPVAGPLGLGADLALIDRRSTYSEFPAVSQRVSELRGYLTWSP